MNGKGNQAHRVQKYREKTNANAFSKSSLQIGGLPRTSLNLSPSFLLCFHTRGFSALFLFCPYNNLDSITRQTVSNGIDGVDVAFAKLVLQSFPLGSPTFIRWNTRHRKLALLYWPRHTHCSYSAFSPRVISTSSPHLCLMMELSQEIS